MSDALYPPSTVGIPEHLTAPNARYRRAVVVVLIGLIIFLLLYLALVAGAGWLLWFAVTYPTELSRGALFLKFVSVSISGMLFLFLVKGLFKRHSGDEEMEIEIRPEEHPELFAFIDRICMETKAPRPFRVFLTPQVNAAVTYNTSLLNLFFPVKKNLIIGLGLVNALTLSEFKAVLAHEFGHFSQSSMRLGRYVYLANRIVVDMVFQRDYWDNLLDRWRNLGDFRITAPAWMLYGIIWVLRKLLEGAFFGINRLNRALSREMEFHADLVAVSVTGSDSLIHALSRLNFAGESLSMALQDLKHAADHRLYTRDLFFHQTAEGEHLRKQNQDPNQGMPPALPADPTVRVQLFKPGEDEDDTPEMWKTHPSNHDREANAKSYYVRSVIDERSPWLLFRSPGQVRAAMTELIYRKGLEIPADARFQEPPVVQAFIDEEHAETKQDPRYQGLYDSRYLEPGDLAALVQQVHAQPWPVERLQQAFQRLYTAQFKEWFEKHQERRGEEGLLEALRDGEWKPKGKTFPFREREVTLAEVPTLLASVETELEQDRERLKQLDAEVFQAHYQMAAHLGDGTHNELWARYQFHLGVQEVLRAVSIGKARMEAILNWASENRNQLGKEGFEQVLGVLRECHGSLVQAATTSQTLLLPPLTNMQAGAPLSAFLLEEPVLLPLAPDAKGIPGEWVGHLHRQLAVLDGKARRIHFKSLGAILALQERVAGQWRARLANPAGQAPGLRM
jgi:Zn-dependent protease with chaperone function